MDLLESVRVFLWICFTKSRFRLSDKENADVFTFTNLCFMFINKYMISNSNIQEAMLCPMWHSNWHKRHNYCVWMNFK